MQTLSQQAEHEGLVRAFKKQGSGSGVTDKPPRTIDIAENAAASFKMHEFCTFGGS